MFCSSNQAELIQFYGYESETHEVTTEDGYILTMFRCYSKKFSLKKKKPLIAIHGLSCSSDEFSLNPPDQSLG